MKEPRFWYRPPGLLSRALAPLGALYTLGGEVRRRRAHAAELAAPLICIGNLVAGGSGKTPIALDIAARLQAAGHAVALLSRGHGGRLVGPLQVDPAVHSAAEVGDEPLLHARVAPAWIARDRAAGAQAAIAAGARVIVMDDGYQNPHVRPDLAILAVDGRRGFGNGQVIPAGPLREPVEAGLKRADAAVVIGADPTEAAVRLRRSVNGPVLRAEFVPAAAIADLVGRRVVAFAGIAQPDAFFALLADAGVELAATRAFADHHLFTVDDLAELRNLSVQHDAILATTHKDHVRLPPPLQPHVMPVGRTLAWADPAALEQLLVDFVGHPRRR
ncbi:MAG: tetraacyldisaccharide 4'-kinase [Rhodospirillaceae bacterium]|nr:tetraacyldisaccharide 4'-kinase [Rhodospirillaceae bacterium]MCA8933241.1 tetraacyldisaccharide 4'-kinase [Rhodospirillaceae bacterium]